MRVCVVGPVPPIKGGISQHTARLAEALGRCEDTTVEVISWRHQYPRRLYGRDQLDRSLPPHPGARFVLSWWNPATWLSAALAARRAHVLVMPYVVPVHAPIQWLLSLFGRRDRRTVVHVHNPVPHEPMPLSEPLARLVLGRADILVAHSRTILSDLRRMGIERRAIVRRHPPDLPVEPTSLPPTETLQLLCFGAIRRYKGFDLAIRALGTLRQAGIDARLTIAGERWDDQDLVAVARAEGVSEQVQLIDRYVPDEELVGLLASHHVVVAPYRSATQSGVVSLALSAGRPVVTTSVGGLPELVCDGVNGAVVAPEDPAAIAGGIVAVSQRLRSAATAAAVSASSWDDLARDLRSAATAG